MASSDHEIRLSASKIEATPGAYPATPDPESPVLVSSQLSLSQAVHKRRMEYTVRRNLKVKVGTWNVAALSGTEKDVKGWFVDGKGVSEQLSGLESDTQGQSAGTGIEIESVEDQEERRSKKKPTIPENDPGVIPGGDEIGIYVLGLQEIVDISSATEALRPFNDPHPARKWKQAVAEALPPGYQRVAEQQLIGLFLVIFAAPQIVPTISNVSTTSVGTGLLGYMGNKGAVTARILLGETTRMVFVNCHLTAGVEKGSLERRNWDASQIQSRTKFDPGNGDIQEEHQEVIGDEDFAFWFGDLNYRLEGLPGEDVRRLLMLHTMGEYGQARASQPKIAEELDKPKSVMAESKDEAVRQTLKNDIASIPDTAEQLSNISVASTSHADAGLHDPSSDPTSLQTTLTSLLTHDQLHGQMRDRKAFSDGWREGKIDFLPTYKYDVGSVGMFDSSEKRRGPSWCDRILFRTRRDKLAYDEKVENEAEAKRKDNEMKFRGVVEAASDEAVLFDYDPETDGADNEIEQPSNNAEVVPTKTGFEDRLSLDYYLSHQRVLSSDHKPLDAVFTLDYDAVDAELKAKVHQEVARELDKAENEGRPVVTIVVDHNRKFANQSDQSTDHESVDFGDVKYDHDKNRSITIANTGRVPAKIGFVDRSTETGRPGGIAPSWLSVKFDRTSDNRNPNPGALQEYTLEPGDAVNVDLTVHVIDLDQIRRLNDKTETLEEVLVLRIHNGRDYFLPIHGNWQQSAFGRSIEKLIKIPEGGVRKLQQQHPEGSTPGDDAVKWSAPRELFRLTDAIETLVERAVGEWEMKGEQAVAPWASGNGWPFAEWVSDGGEKKKLMSNAREALDCDSSFEEHWPPQASSIQRLEALAETLLDFLNSLEHGIITPSMWTELEGGILERETAKNSLSREEEQTWILDVMSSAPPHSVSFTFLTFMLTNVANEIVPVLRIEAPASASSPTSTTKAPDQATTKALRQKTDRAFASIFAEAMIRLPSEVKGKAKKASESRKKLIVEAFLTSQDNDRI